MKKLFEAIRQKNLEEVKAIIKKKPGLVNCVAASPPKMDNGRSPLQVAVKIRAFEIIDYLMENGADVNFMEDEDDAYGLRCPVLHDAIGIVFNSLCYRKPDVSDCGITVAEEMLRHGADPNKRASNGFDALNTAVDEAGYVLENDMYSEVHEKAEQQLAALFDLLIKYGADFKGWADHWHYPWPDAVETNRELYLDDFVPRSGTAAITVIRGMVYESAIKDNIDRTAHTRAVMRKYAKDRGLI